MGEGTGPVTASTETPAIVVQPIAKTGMKGGPGSADELLKAYDEEVGSNEGQVERAAEQQVKIQEAVEKKAAAKEVVKSLESKEAGSPDETTEQVSEPVPEDAPTEPEGPPVIEASVDGTPLEIPEKAEMEFEVNGKPYKFTVADAIEAKLGQEKFNRNMDQRLAYADVKEKRIEARVSGILERAQKAIELAKTGDPLPAIKALARMAAGNEVDAVQVERQFLEKLQEVDNVFRRMTPEQKEAYFAQQRAKAAEERASKLEKEVNFSESVKQVDNEVGQICEKVGLTKQQFSALYHEFIIPELVGPDKPFKSVDEIGPREVARVHIEFSTRANIQEALKEVDPVLTKDVTLSEELFRQAIQNPSWQKEDLKYIISQIIKTPSRSVQNLNRKVEKAKTQRLNSNLKQGSATPKVDEIDEQLYREWFGRSEKEGWAGRLK